MELYILDHQLRRTGVVFDRFESLIWTERFSAWGDFELHVYSTADNRRLLPTGTRLALSESHRVMVVELIEDNLDAEGREMLKVSGRSLEAIMADRVARNTFSDLTVKPKWVIKDTPGNIARRIFNEICRTNVNYEDDEIPFLQPGYMFAPGTIGESTTVITVELDIASVYNAIKEICDAYDLGFRLLRNYDYSELYFDVYSGNDRTTSQTYLPPVVFAPNLDNLTNVTSLTSITDYKNVAYVFHTDSVQVVTADGVSVEVSGFERRVLEVDASDIDVPERPYEIPEEQIAAINAAIDRSQNADDDVALALLKNKKRLRSGDITRVNKYCTGGSSGLAAADKAQITIARNVNTAYTVTEVADLNEQLIERGKQELAKNRALAAFDGELRITSQYPYELAYQLGDLVEMRNSDGATNQMRVAEQIFISDVQGERSYPTLTLGKFIIPGSWLSWDFNQVWETADGEWADKP